MAEIRLALVTERVLPETGREVEKPEGDGRDGDADHHPPYGDPESGQLQGLAL